MTALTNTEIETAFRRLNENANFIYQTKLENIETIDDIFKNTDHCIVFIATSSPTNGHWELLLKDDNTIYFYDSYGHNMVKLLKKVFDTHGDNAFGQSFKLGKILMNSGFKCVMNTVQYQKYGNSIETCGYHVLACYVYWLSLDNAKFSFEKYRMFMTSYMKVNKLANYDDTAVAIYEI